MNPIELRASGYRSYDDLALTIPPGVTAIVGANGSGKSSLIEIMPLALFGPPEGMGRNLAAYVNDERDAVMVEVTFEHNGTVYRARRSYQRTGKKSSLDFERQDGGEWLPVSRENQSETQNLIEATLGLSATTYAASAHLSQGMGALFTEASPRERKSILAECVGLDQWDRLHARVKQDRALAETEVSRGTLAIEAATEELKYRVETVSERDAADHARTLLAAKLEADLGVVSQWEERLATAQVAREKRATVEERVLTARAAITTNESAQCGLVVEREGLHAALQRRLTLEEQAANLAELESDHADLTRRATEYESAERERRQAVAEFQRLTNERTRLLDEANTTDEKARLDHEDADRAATSSTCTECHQPIPDEEKERQVGRLREAAAQGEARAVQLRDQALALIKPMAEAKTASEKTTDPPDSERTAMVLAQLRAARDATAELAALDVKAERLAAVDSELAALRDQRPALDAALTIATQELEALGDPPAVTAVQASLEEAKSVAETRRAELDIVKGQIERCDERLTRYAKLAEDILQHRHEITTAQTELDLCCLLERAYGRDGIPALIVENAAIPQIEAEANRILTELGTEYRVELQTQRALKSGDGLRDTLDIVVWAGNAARPYETFSGGERTRLNLALRIALARLLAHRRGAEVRCLIIDEPDGLDEAGMAALASVLQGLTSDFEKIAIVSHHPSLRDAFEQSLEVVKDGERSRVVGAQDRAPVAA